MLCQAHFSHKQLHKKNTKDMHEMLHSIGVNWNNLEAVWKNGTFLCGEDIFYDVIFTKNRAKIEELLTPEEA